MQFQADITEKQVVRPSVIETTGLGAAYLAGIALGIYDKTIFDQIKCDKYEPLMEEERWEHKKYGWKKIIQSACEKN